MTHNILHPKCNFATVLNVIKVLALFLACRSGMFQKLVALNHPVVRSTVTYAAPAAKTVAVGAIIPLVTGYLVRSFEERTDYTGRNGFHDEARQDLLKMSHYAFHTANMGALSWGIWRLSRSFPDDIRVSSLSKRAVLLRSWKGIYHGSCRIYPHEPVQIYSCFMHGAGGIQ